LSYLAIGSCRIGNISSQANCTALYGIGMTGDRLYPLTEEKY